MKRVSPWLFHSFLWGWESCSHSPPQRAPSPKRQLSPHGAHSWPPHWRRGGWKSANIAAPIGRHMTLGSERGSHRKCDSEAPQTPHTYWSPWGCSRRICLWVHTFHRGYKWPPGSRSHYWNPDSGTWWCSSGHPKTPPLAEGTVLRNNDIRANIYWALTLCARHWVNVWLALYQLIHKRTLGHMHCCFHLTSDEQASEKLNNSSKITQHLSGEARIPRESVWIQPKLLA